MTKILVGSQKLFEGETVLAGASITSDTITIDDNFDRMTITAHASKAGTLEILALLNSVWYTAVTIPLVAGVFNVANNYLFFPKVRFKFTAGVADSVISCDENITKHVSN